jgi:hypothetical protein
MMKLYRDKDDLFKDLREFLSDPACEWSILNHTHTQVKIIW